MFTTLLHTTIHTSTINMDFKLYQTVFSTQYVLACQPQGEYRSKSQQVPPHQFTPAYLVLFPSQHLVDQSGNIPSCCFKGLTNSRIHQSSLMLKNGFQYLRAFCFNLVTTEVPIFHIVVIHPLNLQLVLLFPNVPQHFSNVALFHSVRPIMFNPKLWGPFYSDCPSMSIETSYIGNFNSFLLILNFLIHIFELSLL